MRGDSEATTGADYIVMRARERQAGTPGVPTYRRDESRNETRWGVAASSSHAGWRSYLSIPSPTETAASLDEEVHTPRPQIPGVWLQEIARGRWQRDRPSAQPRPLYLFPPPGLRELPGVTVHQTYHLGFFLWGHKVLYQCHSWEGECPTLKVRALGPQGPACVLAVEETAFFL